MQPALARTVSLLQIATPSRGAIEAYGNLQSEFARLVSDVNGRHGEVDWTPIRYLNKGFSQTVLAGLYRTAQVGVVTPLQDGMNLVAKEYVAAQNPADPGVLVLSKFAGAANELDTALLVNPHDIDGMARTIATALSMPLTERRMRWEAMMEKLRAGTIQQWFADFVDALQDDANSRSMARRCPTTTYGAPARSISALGIISVARVFCYFDAAARRFTAGAVVWVQLFKQREDVQSAFSRHDSPEVCVDLRPLLEKRAQGKPGADCTRGPVCKISTGEGTRAYRFNGIIPAFPARWFYGLLRALPGDRLFCHRHPLRSLLLAKLSASIGAPGPHDFAVRDHLALVFASCPRPPHLTARS